MLKLVIISVLLGLTHSADPIKCLTTGTDKKVAAAACADDTVKKCSGPIFQNALDGISAQAYRCGPCPANSEAPCKDCEGAECYKELKAGDDFMCDTFTFNAESSKFEAAEKQQTCKSVEGRDNKCNKVPWESDEYNPT